MLEQETISDLVQMGVTGMIPIRQIDSDRKRRFQVELVRTKKACTNIRYFLERIWIEKLHLQAWADTYRSGGGFGRRRDWRGCLGRRHGYRFVHRLQRRSIRCWRRSRSHRCLGQRRRIHSRWRRRGRNVGRLFCGLWRRGILGLQGLFLRVCKSRREAERHCKGCDEEWNLQGTVHFEVHPATFLDSPEECARGTCMPSCSLTFGRKIWIPVCSVANVVDSVSGAAKSNFMACVINGQSCTESRWS
jgi:hypothetical protein